MRWMNTCLAKVEGQTDTFKMGLRDGWIRISKLVPLDTQHITEIFSHGRDYPPSIHSNQVFLPLWDRPNWFTIPFFPSRSIFHSVSLVFFSGSFLSIFFLSLLKISPTEIPPRFFNGGEFREFRQNFFNSKEGEGDILLSKRLTKRG